MQILKFFNIEAEIGIIGSILLNNDSIVNVVDTLKPIDFYDDKHKLIYSAKRDIYEESLPIDIVTLCDRLGDKLSQVGGVTYISKILASVATTLNISSHVILKAVIFLHYAEQNIHDSRIFVKS